MNRALKKFVRELKRRKVFHTFLAYLAVSWVILQVVALVASALKLPEWTLTLVLVLAAVGLPFVLILAWVFDLSRRGLVKTASHSFTQDKSWLAAVLHLRWNAQRNDGSLAPRRQLQQAIENSGSLWFNWLENESTLVFSNAEQAISVAVVLQKIAVNAGFSLNAALAIGSVYVDAQQHLVGEAAEIARALAVANDAAAVVGTEQVHDELRRHSEYGGRYLHTTPVKELAHPVRMYELFWHLNDDDVISTPVVASWRWVFVSIAVIGIVVAVFVFFPRSVKLVGTPPKSSSAVAFVALELTDGKLAVPDYLYYGIQLGVHNSLVQLPGYYLADERTQEAARFRVKLHFLEVENKKYSLQIKIVDAIDNRSISEFFLQKNANDLFLFIAETSQQIVAQLATDAQKPVPALVIGQVLDSATYQIYLRAHSAITQSDGSDDWQSSERLLQKVMEKQNDSAPLLSLRCYTSILRYKYMHQLDALEQADSDCTKSAELSQPDAELWRYTGELWWLKGKLEKAEVAYQNAIALDPRDGQAYANLSLIYTQRGDLIQAERILVQATMLQPGHWAPLRALARFLFTNGRYKEAIHYYQRVVELLPGSAGAYNDLGAAQFLSGKLQEAANNYRMSIQITSDQDALSNLGTLYYYLGRMSDAIDVYQKAISITPDHYILHGNLGDAYRQANRLREAKESYERALDLISRRSANENDSQTLALTAHYYASLTDCDNAATALQKALALAPEQAEVQFNAALVAMQCRQPREALAALMKAKQSGYPAHLMSVDPDLASLSNQPEFLSLVTQSR